MFMGYPNFQSIIFETIEGTGVYRDPVTPGIHEIFSFFVYLTMTKQFSSTYILHFQYLQTDEFM